MQLLRYLNTEISVNSGQEFLWERIGDMWYGIHGSSVVRIPISTSLSNETFQGSLVREAFRLEDDMEVILGTISKDSLMSDLVKSYSGLRLMRQEPEQCLFSFLCASNTNIQMIRRMLRALCTRFGKVVQLDGHKFHTFPSARMLERASEAQLRQAGLGFRATAVREAAKEIASGSLDLELLKSASYEDARQRLLQIYGVGPKIADCILLFSLDKLEAFPIDVWIARALLEHYDWLHGKKLSDRLTIRQYEELSGQMRRYFGKYAGYAQQYLYYHMRQKAGKRW